MTDRKYENNLSPSTNLIVSGYDFGIKNSESVNSLMNLNFDHNENLILVKLITILGRIKVYSRVTSKLSPHPDFVTVFENFAIMASDRLKTLWLITDQELYLAQKHAEMMNGNMSLEEICNRICGSPNIVPSGLVI